MKRLTLALIASLLFALLTSVSLIQAATPAETFTSSSSEPFDFNVFIPCALGGTGEEVHLTGNLHILFHFTLSASGGLSVITHFQLQGLKGVGLSSGDRYESTWVTSDHYHFHWPGLPFEGAFVNNFRIIGQGSGNNYLIHENFHITVNANGEITASFHNFQAECK